VGVFQDEVWDTLNKTRT